jgi:hypothetical protein
MGFILAKRHFAVSVLPDENLNDAEDEEAMPRAEQRIVQTAGL